MMTMTTITTMTWTAQSNKLCRDEVGQPPLPPSELCSTEAAPGISWRLPFS